MFFVDLWKCLQNAYISLQSGAIEKQDDAINALFLFLDNHKKNQYPALLYKQAIQFFLFYLAEVLPALNYYEEEDRQAIAEDYRLFIEELKESAAYSQNVECAFEQLIEYIRNKTIDDISGVVEAFLKILQAFFQDLKGFRKPFRSARSFQQGLIVFQENFRYNQAAEFFKEFFDALWGDAATVASSEYRLPIHNARRLFEYTLDSSFRGKAILIDRFRQGQIMPLWLSLDRDNTCEHVEFWNQEIDLAMQESADAARRVACQYLMAECGQDVSEELFVQCGFPKYDVSLKDTSASLLIGIRIVGDILGVTCKPGVVITGEIGKSGEILGVGFINEKIEAARERKGIEQIIIPETNVPELRDFMGYQESLTIIPVRTFADAVQQVLDYRREDWGEAPALDVFYGRQKELETFQHWILDDHCRLVAVFGMGGMGKTTLTRKLTDQIKNQFQYVFWRDLRNAPNAKGILGDCIKFLSDQQEVELPEDMGQRILLLLKYLKKRRCLLVLDNLETILQGGEGGAVGIFQQEYEEYGLFIRRVGEAAHQSCLLVTSREKPREIDVLEGNSVRSFSLRGLEQSDAENLLNTLKGTEEERNTLIANYGGHPLALKLVSATIRNVFESHLCMFLEDSTSFVGGIEMLLEQQHQRLSKGAREIIYWLALAREPVSVSALRADIVNPVLQRKLSNILESLQRKSLIETTETGFTLQPVVMEYMTERIIEQACEEISTAHISLLNSHILMKAQAKDYIRDSQQRLILKPMLETLEYEYNLEEEDVRAQLDTLLECLHQQPRRKPGYAAGNIMNLLLYSDTDLRGYDFSKCSVWQAYLQGANLQDVNFTKADLRHSVLTDTCGNILSVAYSHDGRYLAAGTLSKEIRIWDATNYQQIQVCTGHTGWVWAVAFSPDGKMIASGGQDNIVTLWNVTTGQCLTIFDKHRMWVRSVDFSPDGRLLASAGDDGVKMWDVQKGQFLMSLEEDTQGAHIVTFSPEGKMLACGNADNTIQFWNVPGKDVLCGENITELRIYKILDGHTHRVRTLAFHPEGHILASGSDDHTCRIWDVGSGECIKTLHGHTELAKWVVFSSDGSKLASSSDDKTIRVWDTHTWQCLKTLQAHRNWVWSVAFKPHSNILASGASDQTLRVWDTNRGQCIKTVEGYTNRTISVAFSPSSNTFATSHSDTAIGIWKHKGEQWECCRILQGHSNWVMTIVFSPDGLLLASGSSDNSIRIWEIPTGKCLRVIKASENQDGHNEMVRSLMFSTDGKRLLSGSNDRTVRVWDVQTWRCLSTFHEADWIHSIALNADNTLMGSGNQDHHVRLWDVRTETCLHTLQGHLNPVRSVAFSPDGRMLASGSEDQTVRMWDVQTGQCAHILHQHTKSVRSIAFNADGTILASGSEDNTIRLWDVNRGTCLRTLEGHRDWVHAVAFAPDSETLVSGSENGEIKLWETNTGACQVTLHPVRPYEGMNITSVKGISEAQKNTLKALGAVET